MLRTVLTIAVIAALIAAGVVAGMFTNRWGPSEDDKAAMTRLSQVPSNVGPWVGTDQPKDDPATQKVMKVANATDWLCRDYRNTKTGEWVNVIILYGPSGPLADH